MENNLHGEMTAAGAICPHCSSKEIDDSGKCLVCGLQLHDDHPVTEAAHDNAAGSPQGAIDLELSGPPEESETEIPEWRHELSRRLHEIKRKREEGAIAPITPAARTFAFPQPEKRVPIEPAGAAAVSPGASDSQTAAPNQELPESAREKIVRLPDRSIVRPKRVMKKADTALPLFQPALGKSNVRPSSPEAELKPIPTVTDPDPKQLQNLLDTIVLRQTDQRAPGPSGPGIRKNRMHQPGGDMLILLSRTLSGFLDLLIVTFVAGGFLLSADFFSGIEAIDNVSKLLYGALFLATYLLYAAFFLGTANQTIGMMIKDLKIVDDRGGRPTMDQILRLSLVFLPSVLMAGLGLIWSLFDREHRCLHDRLSHTRVIRL